MLSAYDLYRQGHARLFTAATHDEILAASQSTVLHYLENRLIWLELQHYKTTGSILGKHPIFDRLKKLDALRSMKIMDLVHKRTRLENNLVRTRASVRRDPHSVLNEDRSKRVTEMEIELSEINRLLNV